jgi:antirestriction protein ArdC
MTANANVQSLHDTVTARIISELEAGRFPWVQPWASSGGTPLGLPQNVSTGRTYSGVNILLLWFAAIEQGRPSQRWLTYRQALALGGCVRKGEKGTMVVYADTFVPKAEQEKASASGEHGRRVGFLKRFTVFHVDQCDGLDVDPDAAPLPGRTEVLPHVEAVIAATKADIRIGGEMAFYSPSHDFIQVPPQEAYFEPVNWYRTKLHELGHNAERRIMPRGEASALRMLAPTARRVGIIRALRGRREAGHPVGIGPAAVQARRCGRARSPSA